MEVWVVSIIAGVGVPELLECFSSGNRTNNSFVQERFTPLDIANGNQTVHLKRVRRVGKKTEDGTDVIDIIICAVSSLPKNELLSILKEAPNRMELTPRIENVSRWAAYNERQRLEFGSLWPIMLRKDSRR